MPPTPYVQLLDSLLTRYGRSCISVSEAAAELGLSASSIYAMQAAGEFCGRKRRGRLIVPLPALVDWLAAEDGEDLLDRALVGPSASSSGWRAALAAA